MTTQTRTNSVQTTESEVNASETHLRQYLLALRNFHFSIRDIQFAIYPDASLGAISRACRGIMPRGDKQRAAFKLPPLRHVPPCPACGGDPCYCANCATPKRTNGKPRKPRARRAVSLTNPASAAATLRTHASAEYIRALVRELEE